MTNIKQKISFACSVILAIVMLAIFSTNAIYIKRLEKEVEKYKNAPADTVTVERVDTILVDSPTLIKKYESEKEKLILQLNKLRAQLLNNKDTVNIHDTTEIQLILPRTYAEYGDSTFYARVSGVEPRLDLIKVFPKTKIQYITKYVAPPASFLKGIAGMGGMAQIGGEKKDYMVTVSGGVEVKNKMIIKAEYGRTINSKNDYLGGEFIIKF